MDSMALQSYVNDISGIHYQKVLHHFKYFCAQISYQTPLLSLDQNCFGVLLMNQIYFSFTISLDSITLCFNNNSNDNNLNTAFTFTIYRLVFSGTWWSTSFSLKHNHQLLMFKRNWNNILFRSMIFQGHLNKIVSGFLLIECTNVLKYPYFFHPNH